jgi:hypothetical protein
MTVWGYFNRLVIFVGEVEEDGLRAAGVAGESDAGEDLAGGEVAEARAGSEHGDGAVECVAAGEDSVFVLEVVSEPFAEAARVDGPAVIVEESLGDDGPGVAEGGVKRGRVFERVVEDLFGSGFLHKISLSLRA